VKRGRKKDRAGNLGLKEFSALSIDKLQIKGER